MIKQQSLVTMEVDPSKNDGDQFLTLPDDPGTGRKFGRNSPDQLSSMDEDEAVPAMMAHYLKPVQESLTELKEQMRTIRSDMRRYQLSNRDELSHLQTKDWIILVFLVIALLWQWYSLGIRK